MALGGVPHPTGYPLFLITGKLFLFLSPDPANALTLTDILWGALAAGVLSLAVYRLNRQLFSSFPNLPPNSGFLEIASLAGGGLAGLGLAFAPLVWSQAIIVEIYSLNLLLLALLLLALVWWSERPGSRARLYLLALIGGLGVGHHRTAVFSLLAAAVFIFFTVSKTRNTRNIKEEGRKSFGWTRVIVPIALLGLAAGLPSLLVLSLGGQNPASNWDNLSWSDPVGFWQYLSGGEYRNLLFAAPLGQDISRIAATAELLFQQFGLAGLTLGWVGLAVAWLTLPQYRPLAWLISVGLVGHLAFSAIYAADNSQVYLLPFFAFWAVAAGFGLAWCILTGLNYWPAFSRPLAITALAVALLVPGIGLTLNYSRLDLRGDRSAEAWAKTQLDATPAQAIVLTNQDSATFAMWYVQYVQRYRPEIIVIETRLLGTGWYRANLARLYPGLQLSANGDSNSLRGDNPDRKVIQLVAPANQTNLP